MALAHAMWTHGHSMQIEYPDRVDSVRRAGPFVQVLAHGGSENWFHFAIPTPVIVDDSRLKADSVLVRFKCGSGDVSVGAVHVYDGEGRIAEHNNLNLHPADWDVERFQVPGRPEIQWGVGISINVACGVESMSHEIDFASAGCDFWS